MYTLKNYKKKDAKHTNPMNGHLSNMPSNLSIGS